MDSRPKVVVIVLDGATFTVIRPLLRQGALPHLATLMASGVAAELSSTVPFVTPTAFSTILTGVNPGKHGMFDFTRDSHATYDSGPLTNSTDIHIKTLWELLSECGRRILMVTNPFTYPPTPLNGAMVCVGNISAGRVCSYPSELAEEVIKGIGGYEERYRRVISVPQGRPAREFVDEYIRRCHYQTQKSRQATLYLMQRYPWDMVMTTFVITDRLQHYFWRFMDPAHPAYDPAVPPEYQKVIHDGYRKADAELGEILRAAPEEAHVIVMSDHGFGSLDYAFLTNCWLREKGLLRLRRPVRRWAAGTATLGRCLERAGLSLLARRLPHAITGIPVPYLARRQEEVANQNEAIDWTRTQAYATRWGISINLKSREPSGIVEPGSAHDTLVEKIMQDLREVADPRTGKWLFDLVARKEELYQGPQLGEAPDVLIGSNGTGVVLEKNPFAPEVLRQITPEDIGTGDHRRQGILVIKGPLVEPGASLGNPMLEDLAPTLLYLLGLPIPDYMDGQVLAAAFGRQVLRDRPVSGTSLVSRHRGGRYSPEAITQELGGREDEEDEIRDHLKGLGYIE